MRYHWHTAPKNQGQIVELSDAQVSGAAEGTQGAAANLQRVVDHSDQTWSILYHGETIARGTGKPYPSVEDAITARSNLTAKA